MPQYYIAPEKIRDGYFAADADESRHILKAARTRIGDEIEIFDGLGNKYIAVLEHAGDEASGKIKRKLISLEYKTRLTLCFAPVSKTAAEAIIEHCTEAGVAAFQPVLTSRTQFDWFTAWPEKAARFRSICTAACKQSGRACFPELLKPQKFDDLLGEKLPAVLASGEAGYGFGPLAASYSGGAGLRLFIGPEGGFTRGELEYAAETGAKMFSLGPHTLRAETAALSATSVILGYLN